MRSLLSRVEHPAGAPAPPVDTTNHRSVAPPRDPAREVPADLKARVQNRLISELDPNMDLADTVHVRQVIEELFLAMLVSEAVILTRAERQNLFEQVVAEILGFGPI